MDDDENMNPSTSSDEQIILQEEIIVREDIIIQDEAMDPEMEEFVENLLHEDDVICCLCKGTGMDYFADNCTLCDGLGKLLEHNDESHQHVDPACQNSWVVRLRIINLTTFYR